MKGEEFKKEKISTRGIERLLKEYRPSQLDSVASRVCPFFEDGGGELTSAYGSIHRFVQSRLLAKLQLELDDLSVSGEIEGEDGGRVDGAVSGYRVAVNGKKIEIRDGDGEEVREIAVLEVKTGSLGPLQPAAYTYQWNLPVIVAEVKTGNVHLVDLETAEKFLFEAATHMKNLNRLRKEGQKIPDYYQCRDCGNADCGYNRNRKNRPGNGAIRKKSKVLENLGKVTRKIVSTIREIIRAENYQSIGEEKGSK